MDIEIKLMFAKFRQEMQQPRIEKDTRIYGTFLTAVGEEAYLICYVLETLKLHSIAKLTDKKSDLSDEEIAELKASISD